MMPLAILAPKGLAVLFVVSAVSALAWNLYYKEPVRRLPTYLVLPIAAFVGYAALSSLWSPTPLTSLKTSAILGLTTLGGLVMVSFAASLETAEKNILARALIIGAVLTLVLFGVEKLTDLWIWRWIITLKAGVAGPPASSHGMVPYNPAMSVGALFMWPFFLHWLGRRRMFAFTGVLLAMPVIFWSQADTPALAALLGILTTVTLWRARPILRGVFAGGVVVLMFAAPVIPGLLPGPATIRAEMPYLSHSAIHRVMIWKTAAKHIAKNPVAGLGMDTTRSLYGQDTRVITEYPPMKPGDLVWKSYFEPIPLHPHNGVIQIWLELGGIGIVLLVWVVITLVRVTDEGAEAEVDRDRQRKAMIMGFYVSSLTIASLSFGAWQSWWVCTLWLAATLLVAQLPPSGRLPSEKSAPS